MSLHVCNATAGRYLLFSKGYQKSIVALQMEGVMPFVLKLTQWYLFEN